MGKICFKSCCCFLLAVAAVILSAGYVYHLNNQHSFKMVQLSEYRRDQFLYDEKTGRVWVRECFGEATDQDCLGAWGWSESYVKGITPETVDAAQKARIFKNLRIQGMTSDEHNSEGE